MMKMPRIKCLKNGNHKYMPYFTQILYVIIHKGGYTQLANKQKIFTDTNIMWPFNDMYR